ncbi:uncharacterized protein [Nicotiana sylvestris]|uniref:uncharacterized protein n=1 Tax=Nicotiana sylvestris TaxID=4096 RepID=UPI00388C48F9
MLTTEYELFRMKDDESIQDMHTCFTYIINELHSLREIIPRNKFVRKILSVLPRSCKSKVNAITEAKNLQALTINELVGNLKTYEMKKKKKKKKKDNERREPKKEKNLVLKTDNNDSSGEDGDMAYLTKRFQKMVRRNGGIPKRAKRNLVPNKCLKRKNVADNVVKQALAAWGDSSSESEEENDHDDSSMMAVESEATEYDSIFALMAQSDDDEDEDKDDDEEELGRVKSDLEISLKWTWSSDAITAMYTNNGGKQNDDLNCLCVFDDDAELWHMRMGHASFTLLNKLVRKDLVRGLRKSSFKDHKVCKMHV